MNSQLTKNFNTLAPTQFVVTINRLPNVTFFCQRVSLPSLDLPPATDYYNPLVNVPQHGDRLEFGQFDMQFLVDEDMKGYLELYAWMSGLGYPQSFDQYKHLIENPTMWGEKQTSDITLTMLTSAKNPNKTFKMVDAFPVSLGSLDFDTTTTDPEPLTCMASFRYTYFYPES